MSLRRRLVHIDRQIDRQKDRQIDRIYVSCTQQIISNNYIYLEISDGNKQKYISTETFQKSFYDEKLF